MSHKLNKVHFDLHKGNLMLLRDGIKHASSPVLLLWSSMISRILFEGSIEVSKCDVFVVV